MAVESDHQAAGVVIAGMIRTRRAEIDTTAPFQSVKEAVTLFGERVLAGEVLYAANNNNNNKYFKDQVAASSYGTSSSRLGNVTAELEETKESLKKAKEESLSMADCLTTLKEELELTKRELQKLKAREPAEKQPIVDAEIEDIKVVENATEFERHPPIISQETEFQRKRYVKFSDAPSLTRVMTVDRNDHAVLERHPSHDQNKTKKKALVPLIGGIFSKKKAYQVVASPRARGS